MERRLKKLLPGGRFRAVPKQRSRHMGAVRGRDNRSTERRLRMALVRAGVTGWGINAVHLPGSPDLLFRRHRLAVFIDGCFWHGCPKCGHYPKKNAAFWRAKITGNRQRDAKVKRQLRRKGIRVLRLWEHQVAGNLADCVKRIRDLI